MEKYSLSERATEDIDGIYEYTILNFGLSQARKYYAGLVQQIEYISNNPTIYRIRRKLGTRIRVCRYRSHVIIYTVSETGTTLILRVRHGRENWLLDGDN